MTDSWIASILCLASELLVYLFDVRRWKHSNPQVHNQHSAPVRLRQEVNLLGGIHALPNQYSKRWTLKSGQIQGFTQLHAFPGHGDVAARKVRKAMASMASMSAMSTYWSRSRSRASATRLHSGVVTQQGTCKCNGWAKVGLLKKLCRPASDTKLGEKR